VIFESARISSRLLLEDLGVNFNWNTVAPADAAPILKSALQAA
jgi:hypothetical protein